MPAPPEIEEQEIKENRLLEDLTFLKDHVRKWFVNNIFQRTLAHLVGWTGTHSVMIRATSDGRLRVTTEVIGKTTGTYNQVEITTNATLIKAANEDRISIAVECVDDTDLWIGLDALVTTGKGMLLKKGQAWTNDVYLGAVYGIVAAGTTKAAYEEF